MNNKFNIYQSFFDKNYQTPDFITAKQNNTASSSRRHFIKSAAGVSALTAMSHLSIAKAATANLQQVIKSDPWLTLDATLQQLLPASETGPSASDIQATAYLYGVMTEQPTEKEEKDFILKGVGWLNGYAQSEKLSNFVNLPFEEKEQLLKGISQSRAGRNWLNTLLNYIFQAMLSPQSYGGNPDGIGWQWLEHQPGFPLPARGQRYFELPKRARIDLISQVNYQAKKHAAKTNTEQNNAEKNNKNLRTLKS